MVLHMVLSLLILWLLSVSGGDDDTEGVSPEYIYYWKIFTIIKTINSALNALCTIISLALMIKLELHKRVFMSMVVLMTAFQLLYDVTCIPCDDHANASEESCTYWRATAFGGGLFAGVASNAVTNQMAVIVAYILVTKKPVRIPNYVTFLHTMVPSLALGIPAYIGFLQVDKVLDDDSYGHHYFFTIIYIYVVLRGVQVMINFIATIVIILTLAELDFTKMNSNLCGWFILETRNRENSSPSTLSGGVDKDRKAVNTLDRTTPSDMRVTTADARPTTNVDDVSSNSDESTSSHFSISTCCQSMGSYLCQFFTCSFFYQFTSKIKRKNYPMFALASRLIGYPIVQSLSRFGASWYEMDQKSPVEFYLRTIMTSEDRQLQTVELFVYCLLVPLGGLGCFIIFLRIETDARNLLRKWLNCLFACGHYIDGDKEDLLDGNEQSSLSIRNQKSVRKSYYYKGERYTFNSGLSSHMNEYDEDYDSYDDSDSDDSVDRDRYSFQAEASRYASEDVDERASYTYGNTMAIINGRPSTDSAYNSQHNPINSTMMQSGKEGPYSTKALKSNRSNTSGDTRDRNKDRDKEQGLRKGNRPKSTKVVVNLDELMGDDTVAMDSSDGNQLQEQYTHLTDEEIMDIIVLGAGLSEQGNGVVYTSKSSKRGKSRKGRSDKNLTALKKFKDSSGDSTNDDDRSPRSIPSSSIAEDRNTPSARDRSAKQEGEAVEMIFVNNVANADSSEDELRKK